MDCAVTPPPFEVTAAGGRSLRMRALTIADLRGLANWLTMKGEERFMDQVANYRKRHAINDIDWLTEKRDEVLAMRPPPVTMDTIDVHLRTFDGMAYLLCAALRDFQSISHDDVLNIFGGLEGLQQVSLRLFRASGLAKEEEGEPDIPNPTNKTEESGDRSNGDAGPQSSPDSTA